MMYVETSIKLRVYKDYHCKSFSLRNHTVSKFYLVTSQIIIISHCSSNPCTGRKTYHPLIGLIRLIADFIWQVNYAGKTLKFVSGLIHTPNCP